MKFLLLVFYQMENTEYKLTFIAKKNLLLSSNVFKNEDEDDYNQVIDMLVNMKNININNFNKFYNNEYDFTNDQLFKFLNDMFYIESSDFISVLLLSLLNLSNETIFSLKQKNNKLYMYIFKLNYKNITTVIDIINSNTYDERLLFVLILCVENDEKRMFNHLYKKLNFEFFNQLYKSVCKKNNTFYFEKLVSVIHKRNIHKFLLKGLYCCIEFNNLELGKYFINLLKIKYLNEKSIKLTIRCIKNRNIEIYKQLLEKELTIEHDIFKECVIKNDLDFVDAMISKNINLQELIIFEKMNLLDYTITNNNFELLRILIKNNFNVFNKKGLCNFIINCIILNNVMMLKMILYYMKINICRMKIKEIVDNTLSKSIFKSTSGKDKYIIIENKSKIMKILRGVGFTSEYNEIYIPNNLIYGN